MKKSILQAFFTCILVTLLQSSCAPVSTPITATVIPPSTNTAVPTRQLTATPMPSFVTTENAEAPKEDSTLPAHAAAQSFDAIDAALEKVGYSILEGELGWLQPEPLEMTADPQNSPMADIIEEQPLVFAKFVLSIDIEWGQFSEGNVG